jgi:hypothetical protein
MKVMIAITALLVILSSVMADAADDAFFTNMNYSAMSNLSTTNTTNVLNIFNITPGQLNSIETLSVFALVVILLFLAASLADIPILGVFASLLLLLLGILILTNGVVYVSGTITGGDIISQAGGNSSNFSFLNQTRITQNTTVTNTYSLLSVPYVNFGETLGLSLILLSMFGMLHYGLGVGETLRDGRQR